MNNPIDKNCEDCKHWRSKNGLRGNCGFVLEDISKAYIAIEIIEYKKGMRVDIAYSTPFDWSCRGWEQKE